MNKPFSENKEIFDIVDIQGNIIGRATRGEVHGNPALIHQTVHCLVFNSQGELYLQKRALHKDVQPGKWDTSVGGHVNLGESMAEAIRRETEEELGIRPEKFQFLYRTLMRNEIESELISTYLVIHDGPITPNPDEISEGRFWSIQEIEKRGLGCGLFTPNFEEEWVKYQKTYVARYDSNFFNRIGIRKK
jgi:isopentenyldiphosphate isomerase